MKKTALLATILGAAGAAQAGSASWILDAPAEVGFNETFTVSLSLEYASDPVGDEESGLQGLSAAIFDTVGSGVDYSLDSWSVDEDLTFLAGDLTTSDGQSLFMTNIGQLTLFGPFSKDNPLFVLTMQVTSGEEAGTIDFTTDTANYEEWIGTFAEPESIPGEIAEGSSSTTVIPTPASAALLGLGGLVAIRRRR